MPIDVTDEISVVVILLRAMLDQGYLQEMQDYMMDHPKLKRNIFKELEKVNNALFDERSIKFVKCKKNTREKIHIVSARDISKFLCVEMTMILKFWDSLSTSNFYIF